MIHICTSVLSLTIVDSEDTPSRESTAICTGFTINETCYYIRTTNKKIQYTDSFGHLFIITLQLIMQQLLLCYRTLRLTVDMLKQP